MYGFLIVAALLVVAAGLFLLSHSNAVELRCQNVERELSAMRSAHETTLAVAADASEQARRAHVRLDNQHRQIVALGHDIGWSDERAHTRVLTSAQPAIVTEPSLEGPSAESYEELFGKNELDELLSKKA